MPILSVVAPAYNESAIISNFIWKVNTVCCALLNEFRISDYEIIIVDDGSSDQTWQILNSESQKLEKLRCLRLSRNFGHQYALKAGLDHSKGDLVVTLDSDLQHPPEMIAELINKWKEGFHIVNTLRKSTEGIGLFKKISSGMFYFILNLISTTKVLPGSSDFRLLNRQVVDQIVAFDETQLFLKGIVSWVGFSSTTVSFTAAERTKGETHYTLKKMLRFALDGIMSFSIKPLRFITYMGFIIFLVSIGLIGYVLIDKYILQNTVAGYPTIVISILLIGGLQIFSIGIIGEYLGKVFNQVKGRKTYIIMEKING